MQQNSEQKDDMQEHNRVSRMAAWKRWIEILVAGLVPNGICLVVQITVFAVPLSIELAASVLAWILLIVFVVFIALSIHDFLASHRLADQFQRDLTTHVEPGLTRMAQSASRVFDIDVMSALELSVILSVYADYVSLRLRSPDEILGKPFYKTQGRQVTRVYGDIICEVLRKRLSMREKEQVIKVMQRRSKKSRLNHLTRPAKKTNPLREPVYELIEHMTSNRRLPSFAMTTVDRILSDISEDAKTRLGPEFLKLIGVFFSPSLKNYSFPGLRTSRDSKPKSSSLTTSKLSDPDIGPKLEPMVAWRIAKDEVEVKDWKYLMEPTHLREKPNRLRIYEENSPVSLVLKDGSARGLGLPLDRGPCYVLSIHEPRDECPHMESSERFGMPYYPFEFEKPLFSTYFGNNTTAVEFTDYGNLYMYGIDFILRQWVLNLISDNLAQPDLNWDLVGRLLLLTNSLPMKISEPQELDTLLSHESATLAEAGAIALLQDSRLTLSLQRGINACRLSADCRQEVIARLTREVQSASERYGPRRPRESFQGCAFDVPQVTGDKTLGEVGQTAELADEKKLRVFTTLGGAWLLGDKRARHESAFAQLKEPLFIFLQHPFQEKVVAEVCTHMNHRYPSEMLRNWRHWSEFARQNDLQHKVLWCRSSFSPVLNLTAEAPHLRSTKLSFNSDECCVWFERYCQFVRTPTTGVIIVSKENLLRRVFSPWVTLHLDILRREALLHSLLERLGTCKTLDPEAVIDVLRVNMIPPSLPLHWLKTGRSEQNTSRRLLTNHDFRNPLTWNSLGLLGVIVREAKCMSALLAFLGTYTGTDSRASLTMGWKLGERLQEDLEDSIRHIGAYLHGDEVFGEGYFRRLETSFTNLANLKPVLGGTVLEKAAFESAYWLEAVPSDLEGALGISLMKEMRTTAQALRRIASE